MSNQVILIYPPIYDFAAFDLFNKPLGLLYIGAFLRQAGYEPVLIDALDRFHPVMTEAGLMEKVRPNGSGKYHSQIVDKPNCLASISRHYRRYGMPRERLTSLLAGYRADPPAAVIVTSMMTYWYPGVAEVIADIRKELPGVPVGLGGIYARLMPGHAQRVCRPDRLFEGSDPAEVVNWVADQAGRTPDAPLGLPFKQWPAPAYELYRRLESLTLMSSLGCPFRCEYCASRFLQPGFQALDPETFTGQLRGLLPLLAPQPWYNLAFSDDALLVNAESHFIPMMEAIRAMALPTRFYTPNGLHCRYITPPVARLMHETGFEMIRLSYEASDESPRWQQASDNKVTDFHFQAALENLRAAGYQARQLEAYVLVGMPGQSLAETEASVRAVHRAGLRVRLCQFTPIAHTPLFETACREYGIDPDEPLLHNNSILATLDRRISLEAFQAFKDRVHRLNLELVPDSR